MLNDAIASALPTLRAEAEAMMVDSCRIERQTGTTISDAPPFDEVPTYETVYEGKCRVQRPSVGVGQNDADAGMHQFGVDALTAQLPLSALGIERKDRLTVTALGDVSDPELLNVVATVRSNAAKTHATKRVLVCEEVVS